MTLRDNYQYQEFTALNFFNLQKNEIEMVRRWRNKEKIRKRMFNDQLINSEEHNKFIEKLAKSKKNYYWLVKNSLNQYFGVIYLNNIDYKNKLAYLGIYKNPEDEEYLIGKGNLLMNVLFDIAFQKLKLRKLKLEVISNNKQAMCLYNKSGFKKESTKKHFLYRDKTWFDVVVMSLTNINYNVDKYGI